MAEAQKQVRWKIWIQVLGLILLVLFANEILFAQIGKDRFVDLPGRHRNLLYYMPWVLRSLDIFCIVTAIWMFKSRKGILQLFRQSITFILLALFTGISIYAFSNPIYAGKWMPFRMLFAAMLIFMSSKLLLNIRRRTIGSGFIKFVFAVMLPTLLIVFLGIEIGFMNLPKSHDTNYTLASKIWHHQFWRLNSLAFRDREFSASDMEGKFKIGLLGDSFTSAGGIEKEDDRFSGRLGELLGEDYYVMNLGFEGLDTGLELEKLKAFPYDLDLLVYVWYLNDIHQSAFKAGLSFENFKIEGFQYEPSLNPFDLFYSLNYWFWLEPRSEKNDRYFEFLQQAYDMPEALSNNHADLQAMKAFCEEREIRFGVLMFPWLNDVAGSRFGADIFEEWLIKDSIPYLDLIPDLQSYRLEELVVNENDFHPNSKIHRIAGDKLYEFLENSHLLMK